MICNLLAAMQQIADAIPTTSETDSKLLSAKYDVTNPPTSNADGIVYSPK